MRLAGRRFDPPPEVSQWRSVADVTSYSDVPDYLPYRVPEVWLFKKQQLLIYRLQGTEYQLQTQSLYFPGFDLQSALSEAIPFAKHGAIAAKGIARCVEIAYQRNTSAAIRDLKQQLLRTTQTELPHHSE